MPRRPGLNAFNPRQRAARTNPDRPPPDYPTGHRTKLLGKINPPIKKTMKTAILITTLFAASFVSGLAQVPEPVLAQLRGDVRAAIQAKDPNMTADAIAKEVSAFETELAKASGNVATSFSFTEAELASFTKGSPTPTDEEMKKSVAEITDMLGNPKDLPHLLAYYETLRAANKLSPAQRILHQRTCRSVLANIKKHTEVTK